MRMGTTTEISESAIHHRAQFVTTHWSVVLSASDVDSAKGVEALEKLCRAYWYPLYAYVRRRGKSPPDAQDLTQEFFTRLLTRHWLAQADQAKGRFRSFLLTALERFMANEWDKARSLKRGGHIRFVSLDWAAAEKRYGCEPQDPLTPEQTFERRWALTLLDQVLEKLQAEYDHQGKAELFAALKSSLVGKLPSLPYAQLAQSLHLGAGAIRVAVHRLRHRYRELLRAEIAQTLASVEDVDGEMRHLFKVLAGA